MAVHFNLACGLQECEMGHSIYLIGWEMTSQRTNSAFDLQYVWERLVKRNLGTLESVVADRLICHCSSGDLTSLHVKRKDWTNVSPSVFCGT